MTTFGSVEKPPKLSDFNIRIPQRLIAQYPPKRRDSCRLMVLRRKDEAIMPTKFTKLLDYLGSGDLLILNDTQVFPARLFATKDKSDSEVEVFLLRELENDLWEVLVKPARKVRVGNKLLFGDSVSCDVIDNTISGGRVVRFEYPGDDIFTFIDKFGKSPLPPYIRRQPDAIDKSAYQTVFARRRGAVAAPTAGLHFTNALLQQIVDKGVNLAFVTLHIGLGTFRPIQVEDLNRHHMESEYYQVDTQTANLISETKKKEKKVIAVGTSTVRALETVAVSSHQISPNRGWTDKFIYPPYDFKIVDGIITNLHQPHSTLIMLVSAFAGKKFLFKSYRQAVRENYQFFSYGDAMLIL